MIQLAGDRAFLSVSFAPISDTEDAHGAVVNLEECAVVAGAETELRRVETVQPFDAAGDAFVESRHVV
jgi:hypothetical protein